MVTPNSRRPPVDSESATTESRLVGIFLGDDDEESTSTTKYDKPGTIQRGILRLLVAVVGRVKRDQQKIRSTCVAMA